MSVLPTIEELNRQWDLIEQDPDAYRKPQRPHDRLTYVGRGAGINGRVYLSGQDISHYIQGLELETTLDSVPAMHLRLSCHEGLQVDVDVYSRITFTVMPGYVLVKEEGADGRVRYRAEPKKEKSYDDPSQHV